MAARLLRMSVRSIALVSALTGVMSLAIGAHAALSTRALDTARATGQSRDAAKSASRLALVIGNGHYPDADAPLTQPLNDPWALRAALRRNGCDAALREDGST